jgi:hypothetical protein
MFWAALVARVLVGLPFLVFGLNFFLNFFTPQMPEFPENATKFMTALGASKYMAVVKVLEIVSGAILLSGRLVPLGIVIATPVAVNIALWDILLVGQPALGVLITALCFFLVWAYRSHFAPLFVLRPKVGA